MVKELVKILTIQLFSQFCISWSFHLLSSFLLLTFFIFMMFSLTFLDYFKIIKWKTIKNLFKDENIWSIFSLPSKFSTEKIRLISQSLFSTDPFRLIIIYFSLPSILETVGFVKFPENTGTNKTHYSVIYYIFKDRDYTFPFLHLLINYHCVISEKANSTKMYSASSLYILECTSYSPANLKILFIIFYHELDRIWTF